MLSLKATLKAIGESITTIKSALDGKATKYTGYGTPVTMTTDWYTLPSDGVVLVKQNTGTSGYIYVKIANSDGTLVFDDGLASKGDAWETIMYPVFKGQKVARGPYSNSKGSVTYIPFV